MIKLELTKDEAQALLDLMDAGVKAVGIRSVKAAAVLTDKLMTAVNEVDKDADGDNVLNFEDEKEAS